MGYRGEDLDLRTPLTWTAVTPEGGVSGAGDAQRARPMLNQGVGRTGPIWVDDVVLACSNHAFDVALAHRSSEVRLEHLLHALTRVDTAAEVLEAYGVRVGQLRRDSATVIASEIPVGLSNSKLAPRRSDELEDVLRMAAGQAARRNSPASVGDLLHVMLELMPELPSLQLIQRNIASRPAASYPVNAYAEVMPPMARNPYTYDPLDASRDRLRGAYQPSDPMMRSTPRADYAAPRPEYGNAPVDAAQNTRLDALEQMVRALGSDLHNERKMISGVLQDMHREIAGQRDDASRSTGGVSERFQSDIAERLQSLENAVINMRPAGAQDLAPMFDRLTALERSLQSALAANQRIAEVLAEKVAAASARPVNVDLSQVISRLDIIEEAVLTDTETDTITSDRLEALETLLTADRRRVEEAQVALLAGQTSTANGLLEAVTSRFEQQRGEIAVAILTPLTDRVNGLVAAIEGRDEDVARDFGTLTTRIAGVETAVAQSVQKTAEFAQATDTRAAQVQKTHAQELTEVHEALMKLNANQHTLAGSVDQWRRDGATSIGSIGERVVGLTTHIDGFATRFDGIEREQAKPMQLLEAMSGTMDNMHRVTIERYYRRNRFWYWLFGTDDWVAASWPSHAKRIVDDLKAVKASARPRA